MDRVIVIDGSVSGGAVTDGDINVKPDLTFGAMGPVKE